MISFGGKEVLSTVTLRYVYKMTSSHLVCNVNK